MPDSKTTEFLQNAAKGLDMSLNGSTKAADRKNGFVLLVFPFDKPEGARTNYVSNADRADIVTALKEIVARFEGRAHDAPETVQ